MTLFHIGFNFQINLSYTGICLSIGPNLSLCPPLDTSTKFQFSKAKQGKTQKFVLGLKLRQIDIANQNQVFERRQFQMFSIRNSCFTKNFNFSRQTKFVYFQRFEFWRVFPLKAQILIFPVKSFFQVFRTSEISGKNEWSSNLKFPAFVTSSAHR